MNKNFDSSFEKAMSVLNRAKDFGMRIRFVFAHDTFGNFGLDGKVVELEDKNWLFRGVDWRVGQRIWFDGLTGRHGKSIAYGNTLAR